ncbi:sodium-dependent transporter [Flammeovirga kamogawensis]|uniref:Sodium-dependent transporter n=1 Tax=Flammeovirga kamogawensis TaxID=373891 RepID=A0ABX8GVE1_9BACT|nr:sodium-dependent transporter [Flammeovirga kamogawensis]MBB6459828.1 NSS family neurotransmitter:Na+ symporter [Flammeovirga kamogawensis]QWG07117.1 sodium-dependent transporter [Flammeovirga kamogawensis]TRX68938.1 sodium-dependent transporter [Flammeovirga kamogawensis]
MSVQEKGEQFSSKWGVILASLGMAIGAGNLWRFPRLAGQYGGTFIILWFLFLFIWSIPILLSEFSIGKKFKHGVISSFAQAAGEKYTWMGFFITLCTLGITFYYSVVTAWGLRYVGLSTSLLNDEEALEGLNQDFLEVYWQGISTGSYLTVGIHIGVVIFAVFMLYKGIQQGLEKVNKILIPSLLFLMLLVAAVALSTDNGPKGLEYMFHIDTSLFFNSKVWIEAVTQSAWSTGAGWGLMLTIASYSRDKEDVTFNILVSGIGNNLASLIAGVAILPSVFAIASSDAQAISYLQSGNTALTFTIIPLLFAKIPYGEVLGVVFFVAFTMAAFSSLISMVELCIRTFTDLKFNRTKASIITGGLCIVFGLPSAMSLNFFSNQDWVWGLGLLISGLFINFAVQRNGVGKFKEEYIDKDSSIIIPTVFYKIAMYLNIGIGVFLIWWWMSQGYSANPWFKDGVWNFFDVYSNATIVTQWGAVILIGILLNKWLYKKFVK